MASAGWDEVLGGDGVDGGGAPPPHDPDGADGDDEGAAPAKKKRVKTSTKIVLVVGGWLLLTLFLVGQFSSDKEQPSAVARLDTAAGGEGVDADEEEVFEPEPVDTEEEELLDVDGDGFLSAQEQGIIEGEAAAAPDGGQSGSASGSGSSGGSTSGGGTSGGEGGAGGNAVPGAAPSGGSSASTTTTASGGGGGGGASSTTSSSVRGTTTTTGATTTTTEGGGPPPPLPRKDVSITGTNAVTYAFDPATFTIPAGTKVRVTNPTEKDHTWKIESQADIDVKKGEFVERTFSTPGTYDFRCTKSGHVNMTGTFTVT